MNFLDKKIVGRWDMLSKKKGKIILNIAIYLIPLSLSLFRGTLRAKLSLFFIYTVGYVLTESITGVVKGLIEKYRPFVYRSVDDINLLSAESKERFYEDLGSYDIKNSFSLGMLV